MLLIQRSLLFDPYTVPDPPLRIGAPDDSIRRQRLFDPIRNFPLFFPSGRGRGRNARNGEERVEDDCCTG